LAILDCIGNSIKLEVYLDRDGKASGDLYVDDGRSFAYQSDPNASAFIKFTFDGKYLKATVSSKYVFGEKQKISSVSFYGVNAHSIPESDGAEVKFENLQLSIKSGHLLKMPSI